MENCRLFTFFAHFQEQEVRLARVYNLVIRHVRIHDRHGAPGLVSQELADFLQGVALLP